MKPCLPSLPLSAGSPPGSRTASLAGSAGREVNQGLSVPLSLRSPSDGIPPPEQRQAAPPCRLDTAQLNFGPTEVRVL